MNIALRLNLFFFYKYKGQDEFGNKYYEQKKAQINRKNKRLVDYKGISEASKVPAKYHGWLHHYSDDFPKDNKFQVFPTFYDCFATGMVILYCLL